MRILGLTNFYPPLGYGYGAICRDAMEALASRGHDVTLLCAAGGDGDRVEVRHELEHVPAAWRRPIAGVRAGRAGQRAVDRALEDGVDVAYAWHMRGINKGLLTRLHAAGVPVVYVLGDLWVVYERPGPPRAWSWWTWLDALRGYAGARNALGGLGGRVMGTELRPAPIAESGVVAFASTWLRDRYALAGFRPRWGHIVPNGIALPDSPPALRDRTGDQLEIVYGGRIEAAKGADLAVRAALGLPSVRLTLAGDGEPGFVDGLRDEVRSAGAGDRIRFEGRFDREQFRQLLTSADVFLMPGRIEEAFGLVYLEAMAAGAVVVGTARGGAAELCRDGENAVVVAPDSAAIAEALRSLASDMPLRARLASAGWRTAQHYGLERYVDELEALGASVADGGELDPRV